MICTDDLEYLSKVDQILGLDQSNLPEEDKQLDKQIDKELDKVVDKEDEEGLSETDMRLFNLISINKIDVKNNFPQALIIYRLKYKILLHAP